jgi:hypothetical protein
MLSSVIAVVLERSSNLSTLRSSTLSALIAISLCPVLGHHPLSPLRVQGSTVTVDKALTPTGKRLTVRARLCWKETRLL